MPDDDPSSGPSEVSAQAAEDLELRLAALRHRKGVAATVQAEQL